MSHRLPLVIALLAYAGSTGATPPPRCADRPGPTDRWLSTVTHVPFVRL